MEDLLQRKETFDQRHFPYNYEPTVAATTQFTENWIFQGLINTGRAYGAGAVSSYIFSYPLFTLNTVDHLHAPANPRLYR